MSRVTATLVVNFGASAGAEGAGLILEIDDRAEGLNGGNTQFGPGDPVGYLLYQSAGVTVTDHVVTAGGYSSQGAGRRAVEEVLQFADAKEASLRYPAAGAVELTWIGRAGGSPSLRGEQTVVLQETGIGLLRARYQAAFSAFRLSGVPTSIPQVLVFVAGERA